MRQLPEQPRIDHTQVRGWGIDADLKNDPTYPIKKRNDGEHAGYTWERPTQQPVTVEVLHSNERPNLSAVFGTPVPPSGLSGMLRRYAFKYSESSYRHWLPLMAADRINVFEGIFQDLTHARMPNTLRERGWMAEWRYNRKAILLRVLIGAVLIGAAFGCIAIMANAGPGADLLTYHSRYR